MKNKKNIGHIIRRLTCKALQSSSSFNIAAIAFSKKGNVLGIESNNLRTDLIPYKGRGKHAEMALMKKYGKKIDTIYLFRVGNSAIPRPIDPCETCANTAKKLNIKIISLVPIANKFH